MRFDCDWSSDVCSSDLIRRHQLRLWGLEDEPLRLFKETEDDGLERDVSLHLNIACVGMYRDGNEGRGNLRRLSRWRGLVRHLGHSVEQGTQCRRGRRGGGGETEKNPLRTNILIRR